MIRSIPFVAAVAALLASTSPSHAQTAQPQAFKDWRYQCLARGADAGAAAQGAPKQVCMIQHDVRNGNNLLMAVRVRLIGAQKQAVLIFLLPPNLKAYVFTVRRQGPGPFQVPFVAVDDCGSWRTFVGGGTGVN